MMKPKVAALYGDIGCGKSTLRQAIIGITGAHQTAYVAFAEPIKRMVATLLVCAGEHPEAAMESQYDAVLKGTPIRELRGITPRRMQQTLGTEWRNLLYTQLWSDIAKTKIQANNREGWALPGFMTIIDDLRFPHEWDMLTENFDVRFIKIVRPSQTRQHADHASEGAIDHMTPDLTIYNMEGEQKQATFQLYEYLQEFRMGLPE